MIALVRGDRQADALGIYDRLRRELASELGIDPSLGLRTLQAKILQGRPWLGRGGAGEQPEWLARF